MKKVWLLSEKKQRFTNKVQKNIRCKQKLGKVSNIYPKIIYKLISYKRTGDHDHGKHEPNNPMIFQLRIVYITIINITQSQIMVGK